MTRDEVVGQLEFLTTRTNRLYDSYQEDSVYRLARLILETNTRLIDLLAGHGYLFDPREQSAINEILDHFLHWRLQFEEAEAKIQSFDDSFKFARSTRALPYPKEQLQLLLGG